MNTEVLNKIISAEANVSIIVKDLTNDILLINYKGDDQVQSASVIKVIILLASLKKIEENQYSLKDRIKLKDNNIVDFSTIKDEGLESYTIEELLKWMIITSDNSATNELIDWLGFEYINNLCLQLNLKSTKLQRKMMDFKSISAGKDNFTSSEDMLKVMELLYSNKFISADISNYIINILMQQRDFNLLNRYICDDIKIAHKTGDLYSVTNDIGIVYLDTIDYYIGIFINKSMDTNYAQKLIGEISKKIYNYIKYEYMKE